jgi:hypothetical protein
MQRTRIAVGDYGSSVDDGELEDEGGLFHVSSVLNRNSIAANGLDVARMGAARAIAGGREPEQEG